MAKPGITPSTSARKPTSRKISLRSAVFHIAGEEQDYPTYKFSSRIFLEKPQHNPFAGITVDGGYSTGFDEGFG
jgi:hypothetical protein